MPANQMKGNTMTRLAITLGTVALFFAVTIVQAETKAPSAPAPTGVKGQAQAFTVTVTGLTGKAQVRPASDKPWKPVKVGDVYGEGTEILTGFGTKVDLRFGDNSVLTVKRVTLFRVDKFCQEGQKVVTRSHLTYGKVAAGVEKGPATSDYKITTPLGTLGVNGTREITLYVDPGSGQAFVGLSQQGNIGWNTGGGSGTPVDPGGSSNQQGQGQDQTGKDKNNVGLIDQFGSTRTEQGVGSGHGNQGNNSQKSTGSNIIQQDSYQHHGRLDNYSTTP